MQIQDKWKITDTHEDKKQHTKGLDKTNKWRQMLYMIWCRGGRWSVQYLCSICVSCCMSLCALETMGLSRDDWNTRKSKSKEINMWKRSESFVILEIHNERLGGWMVPSSCCSGSTASPMSTALFIQSCFKGLYTRPINVVEQQINNIYYSTSCLLGWDNQFPCWALTNGSN